MLHYQEVHNPGIRFFFGLRYISKGFFSSAKTTTVRLFFFIYRQLFHTVLPSIILPIFLRFTVNVIPQLHKFYASAHNQFPYLNWTTRLHGVHQAINRHMNIIDLVNKLIIIE